MKVLEPDSASSIKSNHPEEIKLIQKPKLMGKWVKDFDGKLICQWISENG